MSSKIMMEEFNFKEFFKNCNLITEEIKGKGVRCPVGIEEITGEKSLAVKIVLAKEEFVEKTEQELIPASELIFQAQKTLNLNGENLFLNEGDLVLILTTQNGVYYIPVSFKEKEKKIYS